MGELITAGKIEQTILLIRGQKVILDADLARLYGVSTKVLNQAVKRNQGRFPEDFSFRLTKEEKQEVVTNCDHLQNLRFFKGLPYAFTEHGAIMAANVLRSRQAIEASILVVRTFVKLREMVLARKELSQKLGELERRIGGHDEQIQFLFQTIRRLMTPPESAPEPPRRRIGFHGAG